MKFVVSMFAAMLVMASAAAAQDLSATQKKLVDVEAAWSTAFVHKDVAVLSSTIADDWTGQNDSGKTETKAGLIASVKSGETAITSMTNHDLKVRVFGKIAVVQGADDEKSSYGGKDTSGTYTWMDVFENRGGKWMAIASQVTKVSAKK
jgi:ketosteroid isomerase-like protein